MIWQKKKRKRHGPKKHFDFHCSLCGDCCRNVKDAVVCESLDVFRLSRYFTQTGNPMQSIFRQRKLSDGVRETYFTAAGLRDGEADYVFNSVGFSSKSPLYKMGYATVFNKMV